MLRRYGGRGAGGTPSACHGVGRGGSILFCHGELLLESGIDEARTGGLALSLLRTIVCMWTSDCLEFINSRGLALSLFRTIVCMWTSDCLEFINSH